MKDQEKDIDLIIRFFDLTLSEKELVDFEHKVSSNAEFQKKVETYKEANALVDTAYSSHDLQSRTQRWEKLVIDKETTKPSKNIPWKWIGGIAAGFALLFSVFQLNTTFQKPNIDQLIADSWDKKIGLDFNAIRGTSKDSLKQQILSAFTAYENHKYQTTLDLLSNYKTATLYYEDVLLLRGLSYYQNNKIDIALKTLDTLLLYPTGKKSKVAKWYQGLIHLETGNTETAKQFLDLSSKQIKLKE